MADQGWQYGGNGAAVCVENTVNMHVFIRFHLCQLFRYFEVSRAAWGRHFSGFGSTWDTILMILGSWKLLGFSKDFWTFPGGPRIQSTRKVEGTLADP